MSKKRKEPEPRVVTEDVQKILRRVVKSEEDDGGNSVSLVAEKADTSTRTIYRVLAINTETISLDLADRICVACEAHLMECRLSWPDGRITHYLD